jgi:hypothetical protein
MLTHNESIACRDKQYIKCQCRYTQQSTSTEHHLSTTRVSTERQQSVNRASTERQQSVNRASTERQQSINNYHYCILYKLRALLLHLPIIEVLCAVMGNMVRVNVTAPKVSVNIASTESQQFLALYLVLSIGCATGITHNGSSGRLYRPYE